MNRVLAIAGVSLVLLCGPLFAAGSGYGTIMFENKTRFTLHMYVDGVLQCTSQGGGGTCNHMARPGIHVVQAYDNSGPVTGTGEVEVVEGRTVPFTVTE
jgi:hypothetical protein